MRKITMAGALAFERGEEMKSGNTAVKIEGGEIKLRLHGNTIARRELSDPRNFFISTCGWISSTTKERLNGLKGVSIYQRAGVWFLNGIKWEGEEILIKI